MSLRFLRNYMEKHRCTLLGAGPMSKNCVDSTIELANLHDIPILMVASRRQIESSEFGGGYVNNWSTEKFSNYVSDQDKKGKIILSRDHAGPWQNTIEQEEKYGLRHAMESAKKSIQTDIEHGFQVIHLDPSTSIFDKPDFAEILDRLFELYEFCWTVARQAGKEIAIEIGAEEQTGGANTSEELEYILSKMFAFCDKEHLPKPMFVVIQTGTRVMEMRNVGTFDSPLRIKGELPAAIQVPKLIEICNKYGIWMKQHNTDYLSEEALSWHPKLGIHAANVAPEFGVVESKALLDLFEMSGKKQLLNRFIEIAVASGKWKKWMIPDSPSSDVDKALISGHYVFSSPEFAEMKAQFAAEVSSQGIDVDSFLKVRITQSLVKYLRLFRLVR